MTYDNQKAILARKNELIRDFKLTMLEFDQKFKALQEVECSHPNGSSDSDGDFSCYDCGKGSYCGGWRSSRY